MLIPQVEPSRLAGDLFAGTDRGATAHRLGQTLQTRPRPEKARARELQSFQISHGRLQTAAERRFVVQVDFLQQGASVLLDDFVLTKAD